MLHILRDEPFKNAVNMPPVPANVMAKLQPYFLLGERMGHFLAQMADSAAQEIIVSFSGELTEVDTSPLTRYIVKGVLSHHLGSDVNIINAMHMAKIRDVNIIREKSTASKGFTNLITVTLRSNGQERSIAGTLLNGYGPRIVKIDQYPVDVAPEGNIILVSHNDKPGIVGRLGSVLGDSGTNIATMQVGRKVVGGPAIMVLTVDKPVPPETMQQLSQLPDIAQVKEITL